MDLITAQAKVKADSKAKKNILHYVVLVEDEFEVRTDVDIDKDDIYSTWRGGVKIDSPKENKEVEETKSEKTMKTKVKKSAAKAKSAKAAKPAKKDGTKRKPFTPGKVVDMSIKDMIAKCKQGYYYRDHLGRLQSVEYMKTRAKQDYVRKGMHEYKVEKTK